MSFPSSILIIGSFFGLWPKWTPIFLETCRLNANIEWLFLGDTLPQVERLPNVRFQQLGLPELLQRAKEFTGFDVKKGGYSQCDLRPAYGKMFADYVKGYNFWGHCDLDVLWGRIRQFFTDDMLEKYSILTSRKRFTNGHLTLYRNTAVVNNFFFEVPDCRKILESPAYFCLDEVLITRYIRRLLAEDRLPFRIFWQKEWSVGRSELLQRPHGWVWKEGKLFDAQGTERLCLHFNAWKHTFHSIELETFEEPLHINQFGIFCKPLTGLLYKRRQLEEVCTLHYWKRQLWKSYCSLKRFSLRKHISLRGSLRSEDMY